MEQEPNREEMDGRSIRPAEAVDHQGEPRSWQPDELLDVPRDEPPEAGERAPGEEANEAPGDPPPMIYVASLSDYNAGILHGTWLPAAVEPEELGEGVGAMLAASPTAARDGLPAEEWAIHDYEGFGALRLSEYTSAEFVTAVARGIAEHGQAFAAWVSLLGDDYGDLGRFEDAYLGEWESIEAYAEHLLDELGAEEVIESAPRWLQSYVKIDVEGYARDLRLSGELRGIESSNGVWLFDA